MLYTLLKNERIITGPRDWNPKYFEYFLQSECSINATLPEMPIYEPIVFSDMVKLVPTGQELQPQVDPMFEVLAGPNFKYYETERTEQTPSLDENGEQVLDENGAPVYNATTIVDKSHVMFYVAQELPIETIRNNLFATVANNRWTKETTSIIRTINDKTITIYTDRGSRTSYTQALILADDNYSAQWKFPEGFFVLNKSDLQLIVNEVVAYVQTCFDWESTKTNEIKSTATVEGLKQITLE